MRITSEEIAKLAKVSRSTVSRVINNYPNVPDETRKRVMDVIEEYGYEPNSSARILAGKARQGIVLGISDYNFEKRRWQGMGSPYFMRLIAELVSQSKNYGYVLSVVVVSTPLDYRRIEDMYLNREIQGGIFIGFEFQMDDINRLVAKGFNMAVIDPGDGLMEADNVKGVYSENVKAGYMATSYLLDQGHRRIAHIAGDARISSRDRIIGYRKALRERGIPEEDMLIEYGGFVAEKAYEAAKVLMEQPITAIYASNDTMAVGAIRAIRDSGRRVPEDIAIVGCDYNRVFEDTGYHLTTIELSIPELVHAALEVVAGIETRKVIYCRAKLIKGTTA